jgi:hypothetical protein
MLLPYLLALPSMLALNGKGHEIISLSGIC